MNFKIIALIILIVGGGIVLYELLSGKARLRGGGFYQRSEEAGKYWFAVLLKVAVTLVVAWILYAW